MPAAERQLQPLSRETLERVEREEGVYLVAPRHKRVQPSSNQQFGILDESDDGWVGDITARDLFFTEAELRSQIRGLFETGDSI